MEARELAIGTRIDHERYGEGIVYQQDLTSISFIFERGGKVSFPKTNIFEYLTVLEEPHAALDQQPCLSLKEVTQALELVLDKYNGLAYTAELASRWQDGVIILRPGNGSQDKEIPIDTFFHKIVMLRDRLRVLEQNINSHKTLTDDEKVDLQQYITRIYGSLTTFNVLFEEREDYFVGTGK